MCIVCKDNIRRWMAGMFNWLGAVMLGLLALHGLTYRDAEEKRPFVYLFFGTLALLLTLRMVFSEIYH